MFYAPDVDRTEPGKIKYDFRSCGEEVHLITQGKDEEYCRKQSIKIGYFVQKMHNFEILKMRCDFIKDDNGTIWFSFASQIHARQIPGQAD
jgi:hypothetical protein